MKPEEALKLLKSLATGAADWQRSASAGRGTKAAEKRCLAATKKLFAILTGGELTEEQAAATLADVGLI